MTNQPLVSVIIPTYKRPDTLDRAINSVLNQTYPNIEVIVVDDNNPDSEGRTLTEAKMVRYECESRVHYVKHSHNKNGSAARNTGARASKGEFIAFLDDDDEFLPEKIESQVNKLQSLPGEWGMCYNRYYCRLESGKIVKGKEQREGDLYLEALKQRINVLAGSNLLVRREAYATIGGFDESFKRNQDHEFLVRLLSHYKIAVVDIFGIICYVHPINVKVDYDEIIHHYLYSFEKQIQELPDKEMKELYASINGLRFKNKIMNKHGLKSALNMISNNEISWWQAIRVLSTNTFHYIRRRIDSIFE